MNWLKLVGLRLLDFIITSIAIILICVGLVNVGEHYLDSTREKVVMNLAEEKEKQVAPRMSKYLQEALKRIEERKKQQAQQSTDIYQEYLRRQQGQVTPTTPTPTIPQQQEMQRNKLLAEFRAYSNGQLKETLVRYAGERRECERLKRQLDSAIIIHYITKWIILPIALFAVISVLGISLRPKGLTQRDGFVRVWAGVPKCFTQYFAGYIKKSKRG